MKRLRPADLCWCGSGFPYRRCHLEHDRKVEEYRKQGYTIPSHRLLKTERQIEGIRESGRLTRMVLDGVAALIEPGVDTAAIDDWVHRTITRHGAYPATLNYRGFPKSCCISVNEVVCHGIPSQGTVLKAGDIVNVDVTTVLNGFYADAARMYPVGEVAPSAKRLVETAKECLELGREQVQPYKALNRIGNAIEPFARSRGYSIVRELGGHGVGLQFHEPLHVDHFEKKERGFLLLPGMVFTIEPMVNEGGPECRMLGDGWTVVTRDGKLSAQWEYTILVTENGSQVLTG